MYFIVLRKGIFLKPFRGVRARRKIKHGKERNLLVDESANLGQRTCAATQLPQPAALTSPKKIHVLGLGAIPADLDRRTAAGGDRVSASLQIGLPGYG